MKLCDYKLKYMYIRPGNSDECYNFQSQDPMATIEIQHIEEQNTVLWLTEWLLNISDL